MEQTEKNRYKKDERRTIFVIVLTFFVMIGEIIAGLLAHSTALVADGIHMGSHVLLIGLNWYAYYFVRQQERRGIHIYSAEKVMQLSAFASGLLLLLMSVFIFHESIEHMEVHHHMRNYPMAFAIATIGLLVNVISARALHSEHPEDNPNNKAAYLHVLSDVLTKVGVIIGLACSFVWDFTWVDAAVGLATSIIVVVWACNLLRHSAAFLVRK